MDPTSLRQQIVDLIGEDNTAKLEASALIVLEERWYLDQENRVTTDTRDTVPYVKQQRYTTVWTTLPA